MPRFRISPWSVVAGASAVAYPGFLWFGRLSIPPLAFVLIGIACIGMRIIVSCRQVRSSVEVISFLLAATVLLAVSAMSPALAARCYPVTISLALATIFAASLRYPPTIVERIARLSEPNLPPKGVVYTRNVTIVWVAFLLVNALISMWTSLWGSANQWALWNGLLSYLAMGTLFGCEYLVRRLVRS